MKLQKRWFTYTLIGLIATFSLALLYLLLKIFLFKNPFQDWEVVILIVICCGLWFFVVFYLYKQFRSKNLLATWVDKADLTTLSQVVNSQNNVLIAFDKSLEVFWTNNAKFFVDFCGLDKYAGTSLTKFLPSRLIEKITDSPKALHEQFSLKNKKTAVKELFNLTLLQNSVLLLQNRQLNFELENWIQKNQLVFLLLQADFDEAVGTDAGSFTEAKRNQVLATIELELNQILIKQKPWLSRPKKNLFVLLLKNSAFRKLKRDRFDFIKQLKTKITNQFAVNITFSGGAQQARSDLFANADSYTFHNYDVDDLYQKSLDALEMAVARFGDQTVLTKFDNTFRVFGKQTQKKKTLINLKNIYQKFLKKLEKYKNIFIVGHLQADLDVFGSALGLKFLITQLFPEMKTRIVISKSEPNTNKLVEKLFTKEERAQNFSKLKKTDQETIEGEDTLLVVVDTNEFKKVDLSPRYRKLFNQFLIIDHHTDTFSFQNIVFKLINNRFSSTSEIIAYFLMIWEEEKAEFNFPPKVLQLMLMGILIDTNNLQSNLGDQTFSVVNFLTEKGVNVAQTRQLVNKMKAQTLPEKIETITVAPKQVVLKVFDKNADQPKASNIAEEYLSKQVVDVVFVVLFGNEKGVFVSARSKTEFNVEVVCKVLGGGGDSKRGGAQLPNAKSDKVVQTIIEQIKLLLNA